MGGELQETNKKEVLDIMAQQEESVVSETALRGGKKTATRGNPCCDSPPPALASRKRSDPHDCWAYIT